jgi:hypothetical protein
MVYLTELNGSPGEIRIRVDCEISRRQVSPQVEGIQSLLVAEFSGANAMLSPILGLTTTPPGY